MERPALAIVLFAVVLSGLLTPGFANVVAPSLNGFEPHSIYHFVTPSINGAPPFTPQEVRKAYNFAPLYSRGINGTGTRIAVIDAFGSSSLASDLASFDSLEGLPPAAVNVYYPSGPPKFRNSGWAAETSLDVEWAHAIAPYATIDLVVAFDASFASLYSSIALVANSLTTETVVSMSFGATESSFPTTGSFTISNTHQLFVNMTSHGTTPFASSGDAGSSTCCMQTQYPASDPLVVSVGGTSLLLNSDGSYSSETTWTGSTAGNSSIFAKPPWQQGLPAVMPGDKTKDTVDVSYDADPATGVVVVFGGRLAQFGGTSVGSPQWAALLALASEANGLKYGQVAPRLYGASSFHDVTMGSNGFYSAGVGWDYPTGLGSPDANATVNALIPSISRVDADVNGDGVVSAADQALVLSLIGDGCGRPFANPLSPHADVDHDGCVDRADYNSVNMLLGTKAILLDPDVNGDGKVNISDFLLELKYLGVLLPSSDPLAAHADLDKDGKIDITDVFIIIGQLGTNFP